MAAQKAEEDRIGEAFEATISESESESNSESELESDDDLGLQKYEKHATEGGAALPHLSADEMRQNQEDFRAVMEVISPFSRFGMGVFCECNLPVNREELRLTKSAWHKKTHPAICVCQR